MKRLPTWLKITAPVVILLLLLTAAAVRILLDEVPAHAGTEVIQARFAEQLEVLRELATLAPADACNGKAAARSVTGRPSPVDLVEKVNALSAWSQELQSREAIFSDPVILGAEVVRYCGDSVLSSGVKTYEAPSAPTGPRLLWSRSMFIPAREWPAVSLWHAGSKRLIEYEDRLPGDQEDVTGFRLTLDLEGGLRVERAS